MTKESRAKEALDAAEEKLAQCDVAFKNAATTFWSINPIDTEKAEPMKYVIEDRISVQRIVDEARAAYGTASAAVRSIERAMHTKPLTASGSDEIVDIAESDLSYSFQPDPNGELKLAPEAYSIESE